jgi:MGT family glycosyltransferase
MSTILVYTSPGRGHLFPAMSVAVELQKRGHSVRVRTLADEVAMVNRAGLSAKAIASGVEALAMNDWTAGSTLGSVKRALGVFISRAALEVDDLKAAIAEEKPDLLLVDTNSWGAQAAAEASGLPWATFHPFPMPLPSPDAPPFGPGLPPARGALGRFRDMLLRPIVIGPLQAKVPELNRVRTRAGVPALKSITQLFTTPPLVLHMTAEPFEYPRSDWPKNIKLVGPGLWSPPSATPPAWLATVQKPIILVTCSTEYQKDGALIQAALDAFGSDDSVQLVCTTAGVDPKDFAPPKGAIVEQFVPHALVLPKACAVVCHGGMGITQRTLAAGVPVCVVPWGRDQVEVGRRVVESKSGTMLGRGKLNAARLREAVATARTMQDGARRVQQAYAAAGGAERAASLLEELLDRSDAPRLSATG